MRNQLQTFLLREDESALSRELRSVLPAAFFVDQGEALLEVPTLHTDLSEIESRFIYIWSAPSSDIDHARKAWRRLVAEKSGGAALVQYLPSRMVVEELVNGASANVLLSGSVAGMFRGTGTDDQRHLKKRTYQALSHVATSHLVHVSPTTREPLGSKLPGFRVGKHAAEWCRQSTNLLRAKANALLYALPEEIVNA
jgi:hypothetical protein